MAAQTGPRTVVGKINSSRNALKRGIYTNAVLAGEDVQALEELALNISDIYSICDPAGEILVRRYLQNTLQTNRLQNAQADLIEAKMHSHSTRQKFCYEVNLSSPTAELLPDWYFDTNPEPKNAANYLFEVYEEATQLKNNYTPDLMLTAKTAYPKLWQYLMGSSGSATQKVYATLGERLATLYKQSQPQSNIQHLIDELKREHYFELLWGENEFRYTAVIKGLRAMAVTEVITDPNLSKAEGALHRRSQDLLGSIVALKREHTNAAQIQLGDVIEEQKTAE